MTPTRQTQYIITEDDIDEIARLVSWCRNIERIRTRLRSRPNTSPPAPALLEESEQWREAYQNGYTDGQAKAAIENERINAQVAKAEREQVLLLLIERIEGKKIEKWGESERESIFRSIESLRAQQEPQQ